MKREALLAEFQLRPLASSFDERQKIKFKLLYVTLYFLSFMCI